MRPKKMLNKKGVSIIATVGIVLILSVLGIIAVSFLGSSSILAVDYMQSQQAFYIANAGLEWYTEQLQADSDWSDNDIPSTVKGPYTFGSGSFTITVSNPLSSSIDIVSGAEVTGYENQPVQRSVSLHADRLVVPSAFSYAIYAGGNINTTGAEGLNITGQQQQNAASLPAVDFSYYEGIADYVVAGNKTFSAGTYSGIWYVDGNAEIESNVTINGTVVASGNISMNGQTGITVTASPPYPALMSYGNFIFQNSSNIDITGLIYVGADMSGNFLWQGAEDIQFKGTIIVAGNLNLMNTANVGIEYDAAIVDNPPPGFTDPEGTQVVRTTRWSEVF